MTSPTAVEITSLSKNFGTVSAVHNVSLRIGSGEMFGIVGPDGAGKTTLLRLFCGLLIPTSGSASILGFDLMRETKRLRREIGYLSQQFSLYGDLTIDENIEFFAEINEVYDFHSRREELLEFTRLKGFRNRLADQLSGGMKQKLALACTLVHRPKIIFLDEPTTGVDPVSRRDFWTILSDLLKSDITVVMTTPYLDEAERCSRVALMNAGSILVCDTPQQIKVMMNGVVIEVVCDQVREASRILKESNRVLDVQTFGDRLHVVLDRDASGAAVIKEELRQGNVHVHDMRVVSPSLENVFISLLTSPTTR